ncbi:MAG: hypothetical protein VX633_00930, partial [Verrucomicrobiota bacterium]|nr:hypothetical protein [Verrucomicrobiota bacterium]
MAQGRKEALSVQALQFVDAGLVYLAFVVSAGVRDDLLRLLIKWNIWPGGGAPAELGLSELMPLLFVIVPLTPIALASFGFYRHPLRKRIRDSLAQMFKSLIIVGVTVGALVVFFKLGDTPRLTLGAAVPIAVCLVLGREALVRSFVLHSVRAEDAKEAVIYVGSEESIGEFEGSLSADVLADYKVVAHYQPSDGSSEEFEDLLKRESVARVIFAPKQTEFGELAELVEICELQGVEAWISAGFLQA